VSEPRDDLLEHYRRMRVEMTAALAGLTDEQLSEESLDGWSVKDHLLHVAFWDEVRAIEVTRISAGQESAMRMTDAQDEAYNNLGYELRRGLSAAQARWEWEESGRRLLEAVAAAAGPGLDAGNYGESALRSDHEAEHAGWIRAWRERQGI
jgi:uncharacterized damage-inducible protein DinB